MLLTTPTLAGLTGCATGPHCPQPPTPSAGATGVVTVSVAAAHDALVTTFDNLHWALLTPRPAADPTLGTALVMAQGPLRTLRVQLVTGEVVEMRPQYGGCV